MNLFVQVPIDYRGNSPRFKYRPVTAADLEGEKVWWCEVHGTSLRRDTNECWIGYDITMGNADDLCRMVERLLIPIP